ncbi:MAG: DUF2384 domain-containing protein [Mesorhizobium sp.]|nr:MAG: DUF2384 domain-containing protein [Mesorhizobium sp.]
MQKRHDLASLGKLSLTFRPVAIACFQPNPAIGRRNHGKAWTRQPGICRRTAAAGETRDFRRHLILIAMFGDHRLAWKWLMTPTDKLGGNSPIDTLLTGTLADVVAAARLAVEHAPDV